MFDGSRQRFPRYDERDREQHVEALRQAKRALLKGYASLSDLLDSDEDYRALYADTLQAMDFAIQRCVAVLGKDGAA